MIELGISKLAMIGAVALIVIGPEKLPKVARTVGALLGKAQRYVADVKAEVNRSIELEELKKMKESMESAARDIGQQAQSAAEDFEKSWAEATTAYNTPPDLETTQALAELGSPLAPTYKHPGKNWRLKRGAVPQWYKARTRVRSRVQSGAARVARFRPQPRSS